MASPARLQLAGAIALIAGGACVAVLGWSGPNRGAEPPPPSPSASCLEHPWTCSELPEGDRVPPNLHPERARGLVAAIAAGSAVEVPPDQPQMAGCVQDLEEEPPSDSTTSCLILLLDRGLQPPEAPKDGWPAEVETRTAELIAPYVERLRERYGAPAHARRVEAWSDRRERGSREGRSRPGLLFPGLGALLLGGIALFDALRREASGP